MRYLSSSFGRSFAGYVLPEAANLFESANGMPVLARGTTGV
jgi:hypothetical protein